MPNCRRFVGKYYFCSLAERHGNITHKRFSFRAAKEFIFKTNHFAQRQTEKIRQRRRHCRLITAIPVHIDSHASQFFRITETTIDRHPHPMNNSCPFDIQQSNRIARLKNMVRIALGSLVQHSAGTLASRRIFKTRPTTINTVVHFAQLGYPGFLPAAPLTRTASPKK